MFEELSEKLDGVLGRFRQRGLLTEDQVREGLREVRRVLLEADVNFQVTKDFLARVETRATGEKVVKSVAPGQQIVKIVHDELIDLLGGKQEGIKIAPVGPTVILLAGLQGSGKTTTAAKLAKRLVREGRSPMLAALDIQRPAAIDQLETLGQQVEVPVYTDRSEKNVARIAKAALEQANRDRHRALILDTAGRLQIDDQLMDELRRVKEVTRPTEVLLVVDAIGQEAVKVAQGFHEAIALTGVILTKLDGDARGGAALSIRGSVGVPIKFAGVGEYLDTVSYNPRTQPAELRLDLSKVDQGLGKGAAMSDTAASLIRKARKGGDPSVLLREVGAASLKANEVPAPKKRTRKKKETAAEGAPEA